MFVDTISLADISLAVRMAMLQALNTQVASEDNGGRLRVVLDAGPGTQTLGTVTTVTSVTNLQGVGTPTASLGGPIPYRDAVLTPNDLLLYSGFCRGRIT